MQCDEMKLGSAFMWELHRAGEFPVHHFGFTGKSYKSKPSYTEDHASDPDVSVPSATAKTLCESARYVAGYVHSGGLPGAGNLPTVAGVTAETAATHQGYLAVRQGLSGGPLTAGLDTSELGFSRTPVMIETVNSGGEWVNARVAHDGTGESQDIPRTERQAVHAHQTVPSGYRTFTVVPTGQLASEYAVATVTASLEPGTLFVVEGTGVVGAASVLQERVQGSAGAGLILVPSPDSDGDELCDDFEWRYFGTTNSSQSATNDPDEDGLVNLWEQYMGYSPNDPNECFRITGLAVDTNGATAVLLDTAPGVIYRVEGTHSTTGQWASIGTPFEGIGALSVFSHSDLASNAFFRVKATLDTATTGVRSSPKALQ